MLLFNAGLSIPIVCFASDNHQNAAAGFAKPGFTLEMMYSYRFMDNLGIAGSLFISGNKVRVGSMELPGRQGYTYYGLLIGPMLVKNFSSRWQGDLSFLAGISRVHTPKINYDNAVLMNADKPFAFTWRADAAFRYNLSDNLFLTLYANHTQLKPQLNSDGAKKTEQHIVVMNFGAGIGLR